MGKTVLFSWIGLSDLTTWKKKIETRRLGDIKETVSNQGPIERVLRQYSTDLIPDPGEDIDSQWQKLSDTPINEVYLWKALTPPTRKTRVRPEEQQSQEQQQEEAEKFVEWLRGEFSDCAIHLYCCSIKNPTSYKDLYAEAEEQLDIFFEKSKEEGIVPICHVNSGTSQMHHTVLLLAKGKYADRGFKFVQTSLESGLQEADIPFDLAVRYASPVTLPGEGREMYVRIQTALEAMDEIWGKSEIMKEVKVEAYRMAMYDNNIMIRGGTGTGKTHLAEIIHRKSSRFAKDKNNFVSVNCGGFPDQLFESELFGYVKGAFTGAEKDTPGKLFQANGGTLFLDEVGDLPMHQQVKLLKISEEKSTQRTFSPVGGTKTITVDVRIIAATNRPLELLIAEGSFREDLYVRLGGMNALYMPTLSNLPMEDFEIFVEKCVERINARYSSHSGDYAPKTLGHGVMRALREYDWPGNTRELYMMLETIFLYKVLPSDSVIREDTVRSTLDNFRRTLGRNERDGLLTRPLDESFSVYDLLNEVLAHYIIRAGRQVGFRSMAAIGELLGFRGKGSCGTKTVFRKCLLGEGETKHPTNPVDKTFQVTNLLKTKLSQSDDGRKILNLKK